jgi:phenylacetic acid degradation operon negative regulatory protein
MPETLQENLTYPLQAALEILRRNGDFRVWSLIVTLFGDLAQDRDDRISGALLSRLTARMGIRPEAMRVALHRLRKDGWIISERTGRTSTYRLSDKGFAESLAARGRIYAPHIEMPKNWGLAVAPPLASVEGLARDQDMATGGALVVASGIYLLAEMPLPEGFLAVSGDLQPLPGWLQKITAPNDLTDAYRALSEMFARLNSVLDKTPPTDDLDVAVLRVLIVHNWRRLVLRHATLPSEFYPADWTGILCRQQVAELLTRLKRRILAELRN